MVYIRSGKSAEIRAFSAIFRNEWELWEVGIAEIWGFYEANNGGLSGNCGNPAKSAGIRGFGKR